MYASRARPVPSFQRHLSQEDVSAGETNTEASYDDLESWESLSEGPESQSGTPRSTEELLAAPVHDGKGTFIDLESLAQEGGSVGDSESLFLSPLAPLSPLLSSDVPLHSTNTLSQSFIRHQKAPQGHSFETSAKPIRSQQHQQQHRRATRGRTLSKQAMDSIDEDLLYSVHAISAGLHLPKARKTKHRKRRLIRGSQQSSSKRSCQSLDQENARFDTDVPVEHLRTRTRRRATSMSGSRDRLHSLPLEDTARRNSFHDSWSVTYLCRSS